MIDNATSPPSNSLPVGSSWRLSTRLSLLLAGLFISIGVVFYLSHRETVSERRDSEVKNIASISWTVAAVVDGFTSDLDSFSTTAAAALSSDAANLNQANMGSLLATIMASYDTLRAAFITDTEGRIIATQDGESIGVSLADRSYIKALQTGITSIWSGGFSGSQSGTTTVVNGRAIKDTSGVTRAYLLLAFYPQTLIQRIPADLPADGNITVIDDSGVILLTTNSSADSSGPINVAESDVFQRAHQGEEVVVRGKTTSAESGKRYGAYVPTESTGWVVGFTRPASGVDGPLNSRFERDFALIAALLAVGFALMLIFVSRLSQPLASLAEAASAIALGQRPVLPIKAADADVRELEAAMAIMSQSVLDREQRLVSQARILETLNAVGDVLATELDFKAAAESITTALVDLTTADIAEFYQRTGDGFEVISRSGIVLRLSLSDDAAPLQDAFLGRPSYLPDVAAEVGQPVMGFLDDGDTEPLRLRSLLAVPVPSRSGDVAGALLILHHQIGAFSEDQQRLAMGLARRSAIVLDNARLYSEARQIQEELKRANIQKDEFLGVVSHELRTPITTIYGGARLLHSRRENLSEDAFEEMLASIEEESERLYRLVEDLLAIARADLGETVAREPTALGPLMERLVRQFNNRRPSRKVDITLQPDLPPALAETSYLQQVVNNLLSNADKYASADTDIAVDCRVEGDAIAIRVMDRGPGVPDGEMDQIFDSFFRSQSTARQATGKGLGLTVCKRLVEAMAGTIWACLREGGGLEVGFSLPIAVELVEAT